MAYSTDISNLNPNHHWKFDGDSTDSIGTANGTDTTIIYTDSAITEDATNCMTTDAVGDRVSIPTTTDINNSAQTRKAVGGWFVITAIQDPPRSIYGEGDATQSFRFVLGWGNNVIFEVNDPNFNIQIFGDTYLELNRPYHLCMIFEGNGYGNELRAYLDGVEQLSAEPSDRQPDSATLTARSVPEFGDPAGTVAVGGTAVTLTGSVNGKYNHWFSIDGADAVLTDTEVREELFEKGALPYITISSDTESNMQTAVSAYDSTDIGNKTLCIRIEDVSGGGDLSLWSEDLTFDPLASIHIQWMGTGTLEWDNIGTSNATIFSTPNGGDVTISYKNSITITVKDVDTGSVIQGARVLLRNESWDSTIINDITDVNGEVTTDYYYLEDLELTGRVRKATYPYYKTSKIIINATNKDFDITVLMVKD